MNTPIKTPLHGPNVMLMGPAGSGKTHSVGSLVDSGIEVFYLAIESGLEALLNYWTEVRPDNPKPRPVPANLHWHKLDAPKLSFKELAEVAQKVNVMGYDQLGKMQDPDRWKYDGLIKLNHCLFNFQDDRTGKSYGDVSSWGPDRALVIDGLTGISSMAMQLVVGGKPIKNPGDYGIAQGQILPFLRLICDHCPCWFILIAHVDREIDQVLGGTKIMPATVGQKLAPLLAPMFSDVIITEREGKNWTWNTLTIGAETKARNIPWADKQKPDFRPMVVNWKRNVEATRSPEVQDTPLTS